MQISYNFQIYIFFSSIFNVLFFFKEDTDSIADTEMEREAETEPRAESGGGRSEGGQAINLSSRPSSAPAENGSEAENQVRGSRQIHFLTFIFCAIC